MTKKGIVNFYATLEINEDADEIDIKKAYRSLVLKCHPDKHQDNREAAEERIRQINAAYEILSNPTKKEAYDLQRGAVEKNRRGVPSKPKNVSPKMSIPKEFMMQPIGHPDRFVRCTEQQVSMECRQDSSADFEEFFQSTKLSLWWLPEVNNLCRIRSLGSKARGDKRSVAGGIAGGLNLGFKFARDKAEADVKLLEAKKGQKNEAVNFFVRASPVYEGAFRFEAASRKGCFLVYTAPSRMGVIELAKDEDQSGVLDFMLVDFSVMSNFIDFVEVLVPAMTACGGGWVPLAKLREDVKMSTYFEKVLQKPVWDVEDFASYFNGHWSLWEYRPEEQSVRLRPASEKIGQRFMATRNLDEISRILADVGDDLQSVDLNVAAHIIALLASSSTQSAPATGTKHLAATGTMLSALRAICSNALQGRHTELSTQQLLALMEQVYVLATDMAKDATAQISAIEQLLSELVFWRAGTESSTSGALPEDALSQLRSTNLLALAVAATKTPEAKQRLDVVVKVAVSHMGSWKIADIIQLLLVSAKAKKELTVDVKDRLLREAATYVMPQLSSLASADLIKVVLSVSGEGASPLLLAAAREVFLRLSDFPQGQLLLLTQTLMQGLGAQHDINRQILDFWAEVLGESTEGSTSAAATGGLSADQLVKLGQVATLASKDEGASLGSAEPAVPNRFFEALGARLLSVAGELSAATRPLLQAQLGSSVGLGTYSGKSNLQQALMKGTHEEKHTAQARSRSRKRRKK